MSYIGGKDDSYPPGRKPLPMNDWDENADSSISDEDNLKPKAKVTHSDEDSYTDESYEKSNKK